MTAGARSVDIENALIVKGRTRLEQLVVRFNTKEQAKFYITQNKTQFFLKKEEQASQNNAPRIQGRALRPPPPSRASSRTTRPNTGA